MKITKNQLRRIIKEEKQKLLVEGDPIANAERMQGLYADTAAVDALETALTDLLYGVNSAAYEDMDDEDDADDASVEAVTITLANALQGLGLTAQYYALLKTLGR